MILLKVANVKYIEKYRLLISFNDGLEGIVDLKNKIFSEHRIIFEPLQNISFFKKFSVNRWTIEWSNGLDLAPEYLHDLVIKQNKNIHSKEKNLT